MPLSEALDSNNAEMTKRLKYTKDILTHMLNNNNNGGGSAPQGQNSAQQSNPLTQNSGKRGDDVSRGVTLP